MVSAKDIVVKPITSKSANALIKRVHYSGKIVNNSTLHLGAYLNDKLEGVMSFGSPLDKRKVLPLVEGTSWNGMLELNRMAFSDVLPRNSESRAIAIAVKMLKKHAPHVKVLISYADGTQCGDGTIYRAAGFVLTGINKNNSLWRMPGGEVCTNIVFDPGFQPNSKKNSIKAKYGKTGSEASVSFLRRIGAEQLQGFQLRYMYFLDPSYRARLTVPELPYSEIEKRGAKMYKGQKPRGEGETDNAAQSNVQTEGARPISPLLTHETLT